MNLCVFTETFESVLTKGFTFEKSVKTHHPSRVPDFTHGVLVRVSYIGKDCLLWATSTSQPFVIYYWYKYDIYD